MASIFKYKKQISLKKNLTIFMPLYLNRKLKLEIIRIIA